MQGQDIPHVSVPVPASIGASVNFALLPLGQRCPVCQEAAASITYGHLPKNAIASTVELATTVSSLSSDIFLFHSMFTFDLLRCKWHLSEERLSSRNTVPNSVIHVLFAGLFHAYPGERHTAHALSPFHLLISKHQVQLSVHVTINYFTFITAVFTPGVFHSPFFKCLFLPILWQNKSMAIQ